MNRQLRQSISVLAAWGAAACLAFPAYGQIFINEFIAANSSGYQDPNEPGEYPDWIELYNSNTVAVSLSGMYLTDDLASPTRWQIPANAPSIPARGFLMIVADGETAQGPLHANFSLKADGEEIGLFDRDGITPLDTVVFEKQDSNVSAGRYPNGDASWRTMYTPTPGATNNEGFLGDVADTKFSADRGFYTNAFTVAITSDTPGAAIYYTRNASTPTNNPAYSTLYTNPVQVTGTTTLRARAYKTGYRPTSVDTHSYIFITNVFTQATNPPGYPAIWMTSNASAWRVASYGINTNTLAAHGEALVAQALQSIPTLSIVTDIDNLFSTNSGIYANPSQHGEAWERPASIEWIDTNGVARFQVNCGLRIHGAGNRAVTNPKHSLRLLFKEQYGPTHLEYPVFGDAAVKSFNTLVLRCGLGEVVTVYTGMNDEWARRSHIAMGRNAAHGGRVQVYLNGMYWGWYNITERGDPDFSASYMGGEPEDWSGRSFRGPMGDNTDAAWNTLNSVATTNDIKTRAGYEALAQWLDIPDYIDYMLANFFHGTGDWNSNYEAGRRNRPPGTWKFYVWDAEFGLLDSNVTAVNANMGLFYDKLRYNPEFRLKFGDQVRKHLFHGGALTTNATIPRLQLLKAQNDPAVLGDMLRWYGNRTLSQWRSSVDIKLSPYLVNRTTNVIAILRTPLPGGSEPLYPWTDPPEYKVAGVERYGGSLRRTDLLSMTISNAVYYTTDGSDPREMWTSLAVGKRYLSGFHLPRTTRILSRELSTNRIWSALSDAVFVLDEPSPLRVTEIMYNPREPLAGTSETNYAAGDFEFVELRNTGSEEIGLPGIRFTDGVNFDFTESSVQSLAPGAYVLVVRNRAAFTNRYPGVASAIIAGEFAFPGDALDDAGEQLRLVDGMGRVIQSFDYEDDWYPVTDGEGFSLTIRDEVALDLETWDHAPGWRPGSGIDGTPGAGDAGGGLPAPGRVVINEILSHQDQDNPGDWIELYNASTGTVNIGGWYLSDNDNAPKKFQIAAGTTLAPGAYLSFTEYGHFGTNVLGTNGFALSEWGESVVLRSATAGALTGYEDRQEFEAAANGVTLGRYVRSDGEVDFPALVSTTRNAGNARPAVGPVVISEIMYNPTNGGHEFVELHNVSASAVPLYDGSGNKWEVSGIGFTFTSTVTMAAGEVLVLVRDTITPTAFRATNSIAAGVKIFNYTGALDDGGETLRVKKPGVPEPLGVPMITVDRVTYGDAAPWPQRADGGSSSLERVSLAGYGNDPANWRASDVPGGTPGRAAAAIPAWISVSPAIIQVCGMENVPLAPESLRIVNPGTASMAYTLSSNAAWLSVSPGSGTSTGAWDILTHTISFHTDAVGAGVHTGVVTITAGAATNNPQSVSVVLNLAARDKSAPRLLRVSVTSTNRLGLLFDEGVAAGAGLNGAENAANYKVSPGISVQGAARQANTREVVLTMTPIAVGANYTLAISNVQDLAVIPNAVTLIQTNFLYANVTPQAMAGDDQIVDVGPITVTLDGRRANDPDAGPAPLSYTWTQVGGAPVTLNDTHAVSPQFSGAVVGVYTFRQEVSDGLLSTVDETTVMVNGSPQSLNQALRTGAGTPRDVTLHYADDGPGPYQFFIVDPPDRGNLTGSSSNRVYTPNGTAPGLTDSFAFQAFDGRLTSATATVTIQVGALNITNRLRFADSFESYADGFNLPGKNGWYADNLRMGTVLPGNLGGYAGAYPLSGPHVRELFVNGVLENRFTGTAGSKEAHLEMLVRADDRRPWIPAGKEGTVQFAVGFTTGRALTVWHNTGVSNRWTDLPGVAFANQQWVRLRIDVDYGQQTFQVKANGAPVPDASTSFKLANTDRDYLSAVSFHATGSYVDDLVVEGITADSGSLFILR